MDGWLSRCVDGWIDGRTVGGKDGWKKKCYLPILDKDYIIKIIKTQLTFASQKEYGSMTHTAKRTSYKAKKDQHLQ